VPTTENRGTPECSRPSASVAGAAPKRRCRFGRRCRRRRRDVQRVVDRCATLATPGRSQVRDLDAVVAHAQRVARQVDRAQVDGHAVLARSSRPVPVQRQRPVDLVVAVVQAGIRRQPDHQCGIRLGGRERPPRRPRSHCADAPRRPHAGGAAVLLTVPPLTVTPASRHRGNRKRGRRLRHEAVAAIVGYSVWSPSGRAWRSGCRCRHSSCARRAARVVMVVTLPFKS